FSYRYRSHPRFEYEVEPGGVFRTEVNDWGRVTHAVWLGEDHRDLVPALYARERAAARQEGHDFLLDAWSFDPPGANWQVAPADLPSVFHPPEVRGSTAFAVGMPFLPSRVHKGDCDQDRPN